MKTAASVAFMTFLWLGSATARATVPAVRIAYPPANARLTNAVITLRGSADGKGQAIKAVNVLFNGQWYVANDTTNWSLQVNLVAGTNSVKVWAVDAAGNQSPAVQRSFVYVVRSLLALRVDGIGSTTGLTNGQRLEVGRLYRIIGKPGRGQTFADWQMADGSLLSTNAILDFIMQPDLTLVARFVTNLFVPLKGNYAGLFTNTASVLPGTAGHITITTTAGGVYSGRLWLGTRKIPFTGVFSYANGIAASQIMLPQFGLIVRLVLLDANTHPGELTGQIYSTPNNPWTANIWGRVSKFVPNHPVPGRYNLSASAVKAADARPAPGGYGYGSLLVDARGDVALTLRLPGAVSAISFGGKLGKDRSFPFYAPLRSGRDLILGWLRFTNQSTADLRGARITWVQTASSSKYYPAGFRVEDLSVLGARYVAPRAGANVLKWKAGILQVGGDNLGGSFRASLTYQARSNLFTLVNGNPQGASVKLTRTTGSIQGSFWQGGFAFHGVVLPKSDLAPFPLGFGFFKGMSQTGYVFLQPQ